MANYYTQVLFDYWDDDQILQFVIGFETQDIGLEFVNYFNKISKNKNLYINKKYPLKKYYQELEHKQQPRPKKFITNKHNGENQNELFGQLINKIIYLGFNVETIIVSLV
jgi:hypothetical protein